MRIEEEIKQKEFHSVYQKLIVNILYTANHMNAEHGRLFKKYGLSIQQYNLLRILRGQYPKTINMGTILDRMLDKSSNITRLVDKLIPKGYVTRESCKEDKRKFEVAITEEGLKLLKVLDPLTSNYAPFEGKITEEEALLVSNILDKLRDVEMMKIKYIN